MKIKAKKGCTNPKCIMCEKKELAQKEDSFCPKCGSALSFVCEKCHTVLDNGESKLCISCQAKKDDTVEKGRKVLGKAVGPVLAVGSTIIALAAKKK